MTNREKEVFDLIMKDPMITQNEIAEILGITRSSASVFIANLMKKGFILGRGYVVADNDYPVIIGSANVDFIATVDQNDVNINSAHPFTFITEDSNLAISYGGTAKNIAENLIRLEMNPKVLFAVGSDIFGDELVKECRNHGIATDDVLIDPKNPTSIYIEVRNKQLESLRIGLANVAIQESLTPEFFERKFNLLKKAHQILIEDGLQRESINYLTSAFQKSQLFLLTSRVNRIDHYIDVLNRFSLLFIPYDIALRIADIPMCDENSEDADAHIIMAVKRFSKMGIRSVIIPYGSDKICYYHKNKCAISKFSQSLPRTGIYSHYRDTIAAALMYCLANGYSFEDTLMFTSVCRFIAVQTYRFVNQNLCLQMIDSIKKNSSIEMREVLL